VDTLDKQQLRGCSQGTAAEVDVIREQQAVADAIVEQQLKWMQSESSRL